METTQTGVSQPAIASAPSAEDSFQSLWEAGAFEPEKKAPETAVAETVDPNATKVETAPEGETETDEGPEYASLDEYLQKAGIDPNSFTTLPVTVKVDGQSKLVPLQDVLKSYQLEGHVNNKSIELSNQQKAFAAEQETARTLYRTQLSNAQTLGQMAQQQLLGDYNKVNWAELRVQNPAEYAALATEFQHRQGQIQQHLAQVTQQQQAETERATQERMKSLPAEREKMLDGNPEWRDAKKWEADRTAISSYAKQRGLTDAELGTIFDHRFMLILNDAARYAQLKAAQPEALKRVRSAPLMAKPGTRTHRDPKQVARQQAMERFNKAPRDVDAQAAAFEALME